MSARSACRVRPSPVSCWPRSSPPSSTASTASSCASRSTSPRGCPSVTSWACPTPRCRRLASGCAAAIRNAGFRVPRQPHHGQPGAGRPAQARRGLRPGDRGGHPGGLGPDAGRRWRRGRCWASCSLGRHGPADRRASCPWSPRWPGAGHRRVVVPDRQCGRGAPGRSASRRSGWTGSTTPRGWWPGPRGRTRRARPRGGRRLASRATICGSASGAAADASTAADVAVDLRRDPRPGRRARWALEVALAGGHNLLLVGPPGAGKTLLARTIPGLLPPLDDRRGAGGRRSSPAWPACCAEPSGLRRGASLPRAAPHVLLRRAWSAAGRGSRRAR